MYVFPAGITSCPPIAKPPFYNKRMTQFVSGRPARDYISSLSFRLVWPWDYVPDMSARKVRHSSLLEMNVCSSGPFSSSGWLAGRPAGRQQPKEQSPYTQRLKPYTEDAEVPWQPRGLSLWFVLCEKTKNNHHLFCLIPLYSRISLLQHHNLNISQLSAIICFSE